MKIIYVIGTGRNGSTIFDIILGNSKNLQSCGELYNGIYIWNRNKKCACSQPISVCEFWAPVFQNFLSKSPDKSLDYLIRLHRKFERKFLSPFHFYIHKLFNTKSFNIYLLSVKMFYIQVAAVCKKPVLVDSSKNPLRGAALSEIFKNDVYFIHLVRDGRGQLMSWIRSGTIPPLNIHIHKNKSLRKNEMTQLHWWAPALYSISWVFYNLMSTWIMKQNSNGYLRIQYQNFVKHPAYYTSQIGSFIKENLEDLITNIRKKHPFQIDHIIAGNRVRFQEYLILKSPDESWKSQLKIGHQKIFWMFAGWLARKYGYSF